MENATVVRFCRRLHCLRFVNPATINTENIVYVVNFLATYRTYLFIFHTMSYRTRFISLGLFLFTVLAIAGIAGSSMGGCGKNAIYGYTCPEPFEGRKDDYGFADPCCKTKACCPNPIVGHKDYEGFPDPCCLAAPCPDAGADPFQPPNDDAGDTSDASDASDGMGGQASLCTGQCVPVPPEGWFSPTLLWYGPPEEEPQCPDWAPTDGYHGSADLVAPASNCGLCACDPPTGECGLPSKLTAGSSGCTTPGGVYTSFNPPSNWDGSCTAQDAIPAGAQCNGKPCVKSLSIEPLTLTESGCTPHVVVANDPKTGAGWQTSALACQASSYPACNSKEICAPAAESPPGFSTCIFTWDNHDCPSSYPVKHVFYDDFSDTRTCTECECNPPAESECTAKIAVFEDGACTVPVFSDLSITPQAEPYCVDLTAGLPLGSKTIKSVTYKPGACSPSGGAPRGDLALTGEVTFCCLQS